VTNAIVGIHGLANKPEREELADWWEQSIREGLAKNSSIQSPQLSFTMVYWADLLYRCTQHHDKDWDFDGLYSDQVYREAEPGALKRYEGGWLEGVLATILGIGGAGLDALRRLRPMGELDAWVLGKRKEVRDLGLYYDEIRRIRDRAGQMRQARQILMDELKNALLPLAGQRIMVIAHSMGSIIAYDALRNIGRENPSFAVAHFVTIGSPLGLPSVKDHVYEERKRYAEVPVRTPTVVTERWVNYADRDDPVALDKRLRDDYRPNDRGVRVEDELILNDYTSPNGERNPHKSYGYLRTPELSEHIRDFMQE
jgi:hypothetical protein